MAPLLGLTGLVIAVLSILWFFNFRWLHGIALLFLYILYQNQGAVSAWIGDVGYSATQYLGSQEAPFRETQEDIEARCRGLCVVPK